MSERNFMSPDENPTFLMICPSHMTFCRYKKDYSVSPPLSTSADEYFVPDRRAKLNEAEIKNFLIRMEFIFVSFLRSNFVFLYIIIITNFAFGAHSIKAKRNGN